MDQTARISLQISINFKERRDKFTEMRPNLLGAPRLTYLYFVAFLPAGASLRCSVWRSVVRLSAAGEGVFTDRGRTSQGLFSRKMRFFSLSVFVV